MTTVLSLCSSIEEEFPVLCSCWISNSEIIVAGGGGTAKTGVPNRVVLLKVSSDLKMQTVYKMDFTSGVYSLCCDPGRRFIAFCVNGTCHIFQIARASPYFRQICVVPLPQDKGDQLSLAFSPSAGVIIGFEKGYVYHCSIAGHLDCMAQIDHSVRHIDVREDDICITSESEFYFGKLNSHALTLESCTLQSCYLKKPQILQSNLVVIPDQSRLGALIVAQKQRTWSFKMTLRSFKTPVTSCHLEPFFLDPETDTIVYRGLIGTGAGYVASVLVNSCWNHPKVLGSSKPVHLSVTTLSGFSDSSLFISTGLERTVALWKQSSRGNRGFLALICGALIVASFSICLVRFLTK
ncbi:hypothetical protein P9112_007653 [Eukaryota sp. TZLM1-RC]